METVVRVVVVPEEEWKRFCDRQEEMLGLLKGFMMPEKQIANRPGGASPYLTAIEFMAAVKIKRTKFDQLMMQSKIKVIRKGRKIYVPVGEVERYFSSSKG